MRGDLAFITVRYEDKPLILIRDHLDLVQEGKAVPIALYRPVIHLTDESTAHDKRLMEALSNPGRGSVLERVPESERSIQCVRIFRPRLSV